MISFSLAFWWLAAGWCGTPWRGRYALRHSPKLFIITVIIGLVSGLIGGVSFILLFPTSETTQNSIYFIVSGIPAFVMARIITDIMQILLGPQPEPPD